MARSANEVDDVTASPCRKRWRMLLWQRYDNKMADVLLVDWAL